MFTGIIEELGVVKHITPEQENIHFGISAPFLKELRVDQSIAHNGVCLTVVKVDDDTYTVTAIRETLDKSNLGLLKVGDELNLERCMILGERLDGHIVQGHVDQTATCNDVVDQDGSYFFTFHYDDPKGNITIEKGSISVNGVSLTVVDSKPNQFSVAIIPFTIEHTNFKHIQKGTVVNLEFDVIGKYVERLLEKNQV